MIVNRNELANIVGCTPQIITKYKTDGMPCAKNNGGKGKADEYDTEKVIKWLVRKEVSKTERKYSGQEGKEAIDLYEEQARHTKAKADAQELKNEIERGEVAPLSMMTETIAHTAAIATAILGSLKLNMKRKLPDLSNKDLDLIELEVIKVQNAIADMEIKI